MLAWSRRERNKSQFQRLDSGPLPASKGCRRWESGGVGWYRDAQMRANPAVRGLFAVADKVVGGCCLGLIEGGGCETARLRRER
jgi:hypothetical protein